MHEKYPHLFTPMEIGGKFFRNRWLNAPTTQHALQMDEGYPTDETIMHYAGRAKGGMADVTLGGMMIDTNRIIDGSHARMGLEGFRSNYNQRGFIKFTDTVHFYGALATLELLYFGAERISRADLESGYVPYGVYDHMEDGVHILEMPETEMNRLADAYAEAASLALRTGFDMLLIHAGHGIPLEQFVSPLYNKRTDKYGGSLENRARFPMMVLDRIREAVGRRILIQYRISGSEFTGGGLEPPEVAAFLKLIEDRIDIAHISAGSIPNLPTRCIMHPTSFLPPATNAHLATEVKAAGVKVPVAAIGAIYDPAVAERLLEKGACDFVLTARAAIADPDFVNKAKFGREDEIRPCLKCLRCLDHWKDANYNSCAVNPLVGRESWIGHIMQPAGQPKKVAVVGGGPAGMQAALTAAERGHKVTIFEKRPVLGGQLTFSEKAEFKYDLCSFMNYLIRMVGKNPDIAVCLGCEATPESLKEMGFDAVIAAIGASPAVPPIPGIKGGNVIFAADAYDRTETVGKRVVIIGGGQVGCETGLFLARKGRDVTIVEMLPRLAPDALLTNRIPLIEALEQEAKQVVNARCAGIAPEGVEVEMSGEKQFIPADTVVIAAGMKPRSAQAQSFWDAAPEFRFAGDCVKAANVASAIHTGFDAGANI